ncbi:uncharacterized protein PG998_010474 [Apiospora kogelbergensis]|uniref:uncharacterized protein n=1 Tax=Apiospora kogelbergensis TaxID=1337665 RepID=UPI00312CD4DC
MRRAVSVVPGSSLSSRKHQLPYRPYTFAPKSEREWDLCHNQKIRSGRHASFSVFGLAFTYALGSLIVVVSFVVVPCLRLLQTRDRYSRRCDERVPVTRPGDLLAPLDIKDPAHPVLLTRAAHTAKDTDAVSEDAASLEKLGGSPVLYGDCECASSEHTCARVHRALSDACANPHKDSRFDGGSQQFRNYQNRPGTAP